MGPAAGVVLKEATPSDSAFAYETRKAALWPYVGQDPGWDEAMEQQLHERRFGAHDYRIVTQLGHDAGVMALERQADCIRLHQLFLLPAFQGQGVGRQCMQWVMEEARARSLPVRLRVLKANRRAIAFYQGFGFAETDSTATHLLMEWVP